MVVALLFSVLLSNVIRRSRSLRSFPIYPASFLALFTSPILDILKLQLHSAAESFAVVRCIPLRKRAMSSGLDSALQDAGGKGQGHEGVSLKTFLASLTTACVTFSVQFLLFLILKGKLTRI